MGDEASGGSDRASRDQVHKPDDTAAGADDNCHAPRQSSSTPPCSSTDGLGEDSEHNTEFVMMAERDRRNRACSNIPASQSRNGVQQRRHDEHVASGSNGEARNRHRDRSSLISGRPRPITGSSVNQRPAAEAEQMEDDVNDSRPNSTETVTVTSDLTLLPILQADFVQDIQAAAASATQNWQATKWTLKERLCFMFGNDLLSDVSFLVGRGSQVQRIPAHKFVLSIGSAVFDAMFNGPMVEASAAEIELPDVEPAAFISMLRFLYTDEVRLGPEIVMQCLYTAKKYAVVALEKACVDYLKRNLCSDNAFTLLTQARLFDEPQLMAMCLETIDKTTSESMAAEGFTDVDLDTLCSVLERDTLGIRECKLFTAVCRWAEAECARRWLELTADNKRLMLGGRVLELIRFPLMTITEFASGPAQCGLLTDREVVDMFLYFTVPTTPRREVKFSDISRCCLTGKEQVVSRFNQIQSRWGYNGTSDRIRFLVNRKIFIVGFGLYGSIDASAEYTLNIQILLADTSQVCGTNDTSFVCDGSKATFRVLFKEPVEIQASTSYIACATLKGPDSYYGTKGQRKVTHDIVTHDTASGGKVTFQFTYATGNNNGTSVEDGQIPEIVFYT